MTRRTERSLGPDARGSSAARHLALHLALGGRLGTSDEAEWRSVLACAAHDRLITLAWLRSGEEIRRHAPDRIVAQWRTLALSSNAMAALQLEVLADAVTALGAAGVDTVVLKGAPLAYRLYASIGARHCIDIDLYCAPGQRGHARRVLTDRGWASMDGSEAWEDTFTTARRGITTFLELHTAATGPNLAHLRVPPPTAEWITIGDVTLPVQRDALLPAYLAAHLAKHRSPPLLWYLDLDQLWRLLTTEERAGALRTAREFGLEKYLAWALQCAGVVSRVGASLQGAGDLLTLLGAHRAHALRRDISLAQTPMDAARAFGAWVWPPLLRRDPLRFGALCLARLRHMPSRPRHDGGALLSSAR